MGARKQYRGSILCFLILVVVLAATALLVRWHRQPSPPAAEALTVAVDPEQVEEVAISFNAGAALPTAYFSCARRNMGTSFISSPKHTSRPHPKSSISFFAAVALDVPLGSTSSQGAPV